MNRFCKTAAVALGLMLALLAGCASRKRADAAMARPGDELPPDFITGSAILPLNGIDGFSADVSETVASAISSTAASGQLIGRQNLLIYQPLTTANIKRAKFYRGGMFFIWDIPTQSGYVLSEALQAYAPIVLGPSLTNQQVLTQEPISEAVGSHPCHRTQFMLEFSDGSNARLTEWRADDLQHFPVQVRTESAGRTVTVDFSNIRLDVPHPDLFVPPADFTRYADSTAMINELMIRESAYRTGPSGPMAAPVDTGGPPPAGNSASGPGSSSRY